MQKYLLDDPVAVLEEQGLTVRELNLMENQGIRTLSDLVTSVDRLERIPNFGAKTVQRIKTAMADAGLRR